MKLVIAAPLYPPEIGGPATFVKELEGGLSKEGIEVSVVKFSEVRKYPKLFRHFLYKRALLRALQDADAILALDPVSTGLPAMEAAKKLSKPFYVKVVGDYAWEQGVGRFGVTASLDEFLLQRQVPLTVNFLRFVQTKVAQAARAVIVPSEYLKKVVVSWGVSEARVQVIANAVSIERLGSVPEDIANLPCPLVVTVGRLAPWKGMDGVIDAVASVRNGGKSASLALIGEGPQERMLKEHALTALTDGYVFSGRLSHEDTLATLKRADVLMLNSTYEGLSHLLIEAALLGVPTIATNAGGNQEVITHGVSGLLVPVNDSGALSRALSHMLSDAELRARLSEGAKKGGERFALSAMLSNTAALLKEKV